ncbi:MAG: hypothetical protein MR965_05760 [Lachnospiraceae bacterium]|nr:hypothetical protein [Lachnospiraceae bacterium]
MRKYKAIENGIAKGDIKALREALGSISYTNRDFSNGEFDEAVEYVKSKGIKIMDESLVGDPAISSQKKTFTDADFAKAIFELKKNFCEERIEDVKTIGRSLYSKNDESVEKTDHHADTGSNKNGQSPNVSGHQQSKIPMVLGLVAVVVIVVVIISLTKK